jgi:TrmH family RNA methyltransferase
MITSANNPTIKLIRKLADRKERQATGLFFCEGLRIVIEASKSNFIIDTLLVCDELLVSETGRCFLEEQQKAGIQAIYLNKQVFKSISRRDEPQGLAAIVRQTWTPLAGLAVRPRDLWIALDSVADPGNLGTIFRTADAAGVSGIFLLDNSTDPFDPAVVRASMGAVFTLKIVRAGWGEFLNWKNDQAIALVGTSDKATIDYHFTSYPERLVLLMGSERHGLQPHHQEACDQIVSIPMLGRSDSLNLAVATAIILYEIVNHRREYRKAGEF